MGKRKGAAIRAKQRADAAALLLRDQKLENVESHRFESKPNNELFVLETSVDAAMIRAKAMKKEKRITAAAEKAAAPLRKIKQSKKHRISKMDERQIRQLMQRHSAEGIRDLAESNKVRAKLRHSSRRVAGTAKASFDLWDETTDATKEKTTKIMPFTSGVKSSAGTAPIEFKPVSRSELRKDIQQPAKISNKLLKTREKFKKNSVKSIQLELAQPGQSYRPDEEQHQDVIGEALDIELRRKEALDYRAAPLGGGSMNDETLAILARNSDDESSDDDGEDENHGPTAILKRKEKMTRAQRNKQKRVRAEQKMLKDRKRAKQFLATVNDSKVIAKDVQKEEAILRERREEIQALKDEKRSQPIGNNVITNLSKLDPINVPSLPVALTEELKSNGGGLRSVKPKGSLLTDRMESMVSRKMANRKKAYKKNVVEGKRRKLRGGNSAAASDW